MKCSSSTRLSHGASLNGAGSPTIRSPVRLPHYACESSSGLATSRARGSNTDELADLRAGPRPVCRPKGAAVSAAAPIFLLMPDRTTPRAPPFIRRGQKGGVAALRRPAHLPVGPVVVLQPGVLAGEVVRLLRGVLLFEAEIFSAPLFCGFGGDGERLMRDTAERFFDIPNTVL